MSYKMNSLNHSVCQFARQTCSVGGKHYIRFDGSPLQQARLLKDHAHTRALWRKINLNGTGVRLVQTCGKVQKRGLANSRRANQRNEFSCLNRKREVVEYLTRLACQRMTEALRYICEYNTLAHTEATRRQRVMRRSSAWIRPYSMTAITAPKTIVQARTPATFCELNS